VSWTFAGTNTTGFGIIRVAVITVLQCNKKLRTEKICFKPLCQGKLLFSKTVEGEKVYKMGAFLDPSPKLFKKVT